MKIKKVSISTKNAQNLTSGNITKLLGMVFAVGLSACSSLETPTPQKLSQDIYSIPPATVISVISDETYPMSVGTQIVEKAGTYKTMENTYDNDGYRVLIPKDAIINGTYKNDGTSCTVTWNAIYVNKSEFKNNQGSLALREVTEPSVCNPTQGVKAGNRLTIRFSPQVRRGIN